MKSPFPLVLLLFGAALTPPAWAQDTPRTEAGETRVVVLRNGNVLHGEVYSLGDQYRIVTQTSEIRMWARDVERITSTLLEAYEAKRLEVHHPGPDDHLRLAAWAIRQGMWPQAAREINDARTQDPTHPAIPTFESRLTMASRAAERRQEQRASNELSATSVAQAAGEAEMAELNALADSLPEGTVEEFTRTVQPILVHNCSTAGCHHTSDSRSFRLNRDLLHGVANRRSTLRNLMATLQAIDRENVERSGLLTKPAAPHGGLSDPVFTGNRQQLHDRLVQWAYAATGQEPTPAATEPADSSELAETELVPSARYDTHQANALQPLSGEANAQEVLPASGNPERAAQSPAEPTSRSTEKLRFWQVDADGERIESTQQRGARRTDFVARDEFDPEIFNRQQQQARESAPAQASQAAPPR